jgi:ABC-type Fe3+-hydroxamate transport system substrate-binding protein
MLDDLGGAVQLPRPVRRVVSLVPSLTEAMAVSAPGLLVGATRYCTHPADLDVPRVEGTKWPAVDAVLALRPDLVLANKEENRPEDVATLRAAGVAVWVTYPRTVDEALTSLRRMLAAVSVPVPDWLRRAGEVWVPRSSPALAPPPLAQRAVIPVWRRPWVVVGSATFAGDVLARLGVRNAYAEDCERYPRPTLAEIRAGAPDLVVLPDEPYAFAATDGPESFPDTPCALVSGRHLTWYGPSLVEARAVLLAQLRAAHPYG